MPSKKTITSKKNRAAKKARKKEEEEAVRKKQEFEAVNYSLASYDHVIGAANQSIKNFGRCMLKESVCSREDRIDAFEKVREHMRDHINHVKALREEYLKTKPIYGGDEFNDRMLASFEKLLAHIHAYNVTMTNILKGPFLEAFENRGQDFEQYINSDLKTASEVWRRKLEREGKPPIIPIPDFFYNRV